MSLRDMLLGLCVVTVWGFNFVVIKVGLYDMPPFLLAGLRFTLVALPAVFFIKPPKAPLRWIVAYGMTICFGQFALLFLSIYLGMPAGLASLVLQAQAFFTIILAALLMGDKLRWNHIAGTLLAAAGMLFLAEASMAGSASGGVNGLTMFLTLAAAFSWALGNLSNKMIMRDKSVSVMSLVVWSALVPIGPFFLMSWLFEGPEMIIQSLQNLNLTTVSAIFYLAFIASILGYGLWGGLLSRCEIGQVAPLTLLVPVVGLFSAAVFLGESLTPYQLIGAAIVIAGLGINVFGGRLKRKGLAKSTN